MKRAKWIVIFIASGLILTPTAWSQSLGITGGVNIANFNGIKNATTKNGMIIGAFINYSFMGGIQLQPEVLFSMKGASGATILGGNTGGPPTATQTYDFTLSYIEVPVLLKANVLEVPLLPIDVDIFAGPDFAFNVASKNKTTLANITTTTDEMSNTRPFDFNITIGAGPEIDLAGMTLGAEVRYTFGTGPVFKNSLPVKPLSDVKNGAWSIMASIGF